MPITGNNNIKKIIIFRLNYNCGRRKANRVGTINKTNIMNQFRQLCMGVLLLFLGTSLSAQSFAVKGGLNLANVSVSDDSGLFEDDDFDTDNRTTFHLGLMADFPMGNVLSFQTGLIYQNRGYKIEGSEDFFGVNITSKATQKVTYLDLPLTLKASFELGSVTAYVYGGGYLGVGLSGEVEAESTTAGQTQTSTEDLEFGDDGDIKRLDYGALIGAGVEVNSVFVELSYGLGLADISVVDSDDFSINNRLISLSLGYRFNQ